jgi:hypothetical protein
MQIERLIGAGSKPGTVMVEISDPKARARLDTEKELWAAHDAVATPRVTQSSVRRLSDALDSYFAARR